MDAGSRITLVVGVVTAVVALIGYWSNQHIKRRETKIPVYAEALLAIHQYEELPYAIRHRKQAEDGEVRAMLAEKMSDVFARINYHQTLLTMDAPVVGQAYAALFDRTREYGGPHRREAWNTSPIVADVDMSQAAYFPYDNQDELDVCLLAMRRELAPWGWLVRSVTRRRIEALRTQRPARGESEWMRQRREQVQRQDP
ncbi:hypothetical protein [Streptomyces sp. NRRL B-24720]|uniref:hypothetical protein n=1 Tax=Streptomyces sp. NRRL B-24720 TaxID=1476876 RepID=UPI00068C72CB|nr:hypothetical protein [Streptomyces sp. NRRL B-24720]